jgi:hypothetical protein
MDESQSLADCLGIQGSFAMRRRYLKVWPKKYC